MQMQENLDQVETGLRRLPPSPVPPEFLARLRAVPMQLHSGRELEPKPIVHWQKWFAGWRWLTWSMPAAIGLLLWLVGPRALDPERPAQAETHGLRADAVQVGHSLIASFDTVAQMPDGEPVRFHCRQWQDEVVLHDDANGILISQIAPRVEVVPVRFETY